MTIPTSTVAGDVPVESSSSAVSWGPIIAGGLVAAVTTLVLLLVGAGLGLTLVSPWASQSASATTLGVTTAVWLVVVQWLSAGLGGYLTGRLRTKWVGVHTDEVAFRDTAHGFLAWALATLLVVSVLSAGVSAIVSTGAQATAAVAGAAGSAAATAAADKSDELTAAYFTDALLRPADVRTPPAATPAQSNAEAVAQLSRILAKAAIAGKMPDEDRAYVDRLVAARTGLSDADAKKRVDTVLQQIDTAKVETQKAADAARKAASATALLGALSMFIGAFIAAVAAALGGRRRDEDEEAWTG